MSSRGVGRGILLHSKPRTVRFTDADVPECGPLDQLKKQMVALETKLQQAALDNVSRAKEDEQLSVRRRNLEQVHRNLLGRETALEQERLDLARERQELIHAKQELARRERELDEGLKEFTLNLAKLGAPKSDQ